MRSEEGLSSPVVSTGMGERTLRFCKELQSRIRSVTAALDKAKKEGRSVSSLLLVVAWPFGRAKSRSMVTFVLLPCHGFIYSFVHSFLCLFCLFVSFVITSLLPSSVSIFVFLLLLVFFPIFSSLSFSFSFFFFLSFTSFLFCPFCCGVHFTLFLSQEIEVAREGELHESIFSGGAFEGAPVTRKEVRNGEIDEIEYFPSFFLLWRVDVHILFLFAVGVSRDCFYVVLWPDAFYLVMIIV